MDRDFLRPTLRYKAPLYCTVAVMYVTQTSTVRSHSSNFHLLMEPEPPRQHEVPEVIQTAIRRVCLATHWDCGEHGFCSVDQNGHLGCICLDDNDKHVYGGLTCERRGEVLPIPSEYIIGLSVGVIVGLLVALVCLVADSYFGCRKKLSGQEERSVSDDLEVDISDTNSFPPRTSSREVTQDHISLPREVTQDHISLHMQDGETEDVVQSPPPESEASPSDVRPRSDWGAHPSVFRQRVVLPRIPSTHAHSAVDQPSSSSLLCQETLTQLSDCYYNQTTSEEAEGSEWKFNSYLPLDSTYRVLLIGSLGPEPVFVYEPWRNIDKLQFPPQSDPPCPSDKLYRSPNFGHGDAEQSSHRARLRSEAGVHPDETLVFRRDSCSSSSSDSTNTLVCSTSEGICSWKLADHDAEPSNSQESDSESSRSDHKVVQSADSDSIKASFSNFAEVSLPAGNRDFQNNRLS